jgi:hypothetical protein
MVWREFSRRAIAAQRAEGGGADVRFYAEKHMNTWELDLADLPRIKVLALLRDPRDTYVSIQAFKGRRAQAGDRLGGRMGQYPGEPDADWLSRHLERQKARLQWLIQELRTGGMPVVRYADLVLDLPGQASRIEEWLEVDLDPDAARADQELRAGHVSAESPESSIGRWRSEMPAELARRFHAELGQEMRELGFDVPGGSVGPAPLLPSERSA